MAEKFRFGERNTTFHLSVCNLSNSNLRINLFQILHTLYNINTDFIYFINLFVLNNFTDLLLSIIIMLTHIAYNKLLGENETYISTMFIAYSFSFHLVSSCLAVLWASQYACIASCASAIFKRFHYSRYFIKILSSFYYRHLSSLHELRLVCCFSFLFGKHFVCRARHRFQSNETASISNTFCRLCARSKNCKLCICFLCK